VRMLEADEFPFREDRRSRPNHARNKTVDSQGGATQKIIAEGSASRDVDSQSRHIVEQANTRENSKRGRGFERWSHPWFCYWFPGFCSFYWVFRKEVWSHTLLLPLIRYMEASQNTVALYGFCIREAGIVFSDFRMHCWVFCTMEYNTISVVSLFTFPSKEFIPFCSKLKRQHNSTWKLITW